jgi:hypothetical protein
LLFLFVSVVLGIESRALCVLSMHSTAEVASSFHWFS